MEIRYVQFADKEFWFQLDSHMSESEFEKKVLSRQGYVIFNKAQPVGILRYNLFWDNTPFCNLLYIDTPYQRMGYGRSLLRFWESDMQRLGYKTVLTSTQANETAQHFYRALGYLECGTLFLENTPELFFQKKL